jgi:hypothetical protein
LCLQLQHIKLRPGPLAVLYRHQRDPSNEEVTSATTPTTNYSPFSSSVSFSAHPDAFLFS